MRKEFVRDFVISKGLAENSRETGEDAIVHGKRVGQVCFKLSAYVLNPNIKIIALWRDWDFKSWTDLFEFSRTHQVFVEKDKQDEAPFLVDANLLSALSEGKILEDPALYVFLNMSIYRLFYVNISR